MNYKKLTKEQLELLLDTMNNLKESCATLRIGACDICGKMSELYMEYDNDFDEYDSENDNESIMLCDCLEKGDN